MIAKSPELRLIYDDRAKEAKDRYSELKDAEARGKLIGRIQTLQELVSDTISDDAILSSQTSESLERMIRELKLRLVKRG